jgi:hypothetical protein
LFHPAPLWGYQQKHKTAMLKPLMIEAQKISPFSWLPFQAQRVNYGPITIDVFVLNIVQQAAASAHKHQQSPAGVVIFFVNLQMLSEGGNTMGQQADLDFGRTRIGFMQLELVNQFLFVFCVKNHFYSLL